MTGLILAYPFIAIVGVLGIVVVLFVYLYLRLTAEPAESKSSRPAPCPAGKPRAWPPPPRHARGPLRSLTRVWRAATRTSSPGRAAVSAEGSPSPAGGPVTAAPSLAAAVKTALWAWCERVRQEAEAKP